MKWSLLLISLTTIIDAIRLRVIVLAYNRPTELSLTLHSLSRAFFRPETPLSIHIDGPPDHLATETVRAAQSFNWRYGEKTVSSSSINKGILGQWKDSWDPHMDNEEFGLFVEDDIEIATAAPILLLHLINRYKDDPSIYGIALQKAQWIMGSHHPNKWRRLNLSHRQHHPQHTNSFKYFATGTWGQLMFPEPWRKFRNHTASTAVVDGLLTDHWQQERPGRNLFSPQFNRFVLAQDPPIHNLYINFANGTALATSRQPIGVNTKIQNYHERLLTESESTEFITPKPVVKNHCWDSPESSHDQLSNFGFVVTGGPRCCLEGKWRIGIQHNDRLYPQFSQVDSFLGCWETDPIKYLQQFLKSPNNVQLISEEHKVLIGSLTFSSTFSWAQVIVPKDIFNSSSRNVLSDRVTCATLQCPFRKGKYPAGYT